MSTGSRLSAVMRRLPCIRAATRGPISSTTRCIIWRCWNKRPRRWIKRRLWMIGLRRLMEARMGTVGRREFIQVLRLMENYHQHQVEKAVSEALRLSAISFDAVKMLLLARLEKLLAEPPRSTKVSTMLRTSHCLQVFYRANNVSG